MPPPAAGNALLRRQHTEHRHARCGAINSFSALHYRAHAGSPLIRNSRVTHLASRISRCAHCLRRCASIPVIQGRFHAPTITGNEHLRQHCGIGSACFSYRGCSRTARLSRRHQLIAFIKHPGVIRRRIQQCCRRSGQRAICQGYAEAILSMNISSNRSLTRRRMKRAQFARVCKTGRRALARRDQLFNRTASARRYGQASKPHHLARNS